MMKATHTIVANGKVDRQRSESATTDRAERRTDKGYEVEKPDHERERQRVRAPPGSTARSRSRTVASHADRDVPQHIVGDGLVCVDDETSVPLLAPTPVSDRAMFTYWRPCRMAGT